MCDTPACSAASIAPVCCGRREPTLSVLMIRRRATPLKAAASEAGSLKSPLPDVDAREVGQALTGSRVIGDDVLGAARLELADHGAAEMAIGAGDAEN